MARWRLAVSHYLLIDGTEWEYKELDRVTGRETRKRFQVPRLLDINDPLDWTEKVVGRDGSAIEGFINVTNGSGGDSSDIVFHGDPTPDMIPLDDEARNISASFAGRWKHPIDGLEGSYADSLLQQFQSEIAKVQSTSKPVQVDGMAELLTAMTAMMQQNQEMLKTLSGRRA